MSLIDNYKKYKNRKEKLKENKTYPNYMCNDEFWIIYNKLAGNGENNSRKLELPLNRILEDKTLDILRNKI